MAGKTTFKKLRCITISLIIGIVLGSIGTLFLQNFNPPDEERPVSASIVFDRIVAQDELVCASQQYNITDKATSAASFFDICDIPFTENSFWYRYVGTIKVGVDMKNATYSTFGSTITIELDQPYIISNTPNMEKSGVLEENNNIFNPIQVENVDEFQRQCIEQSEADIMEGGIMDEARMNAERNISDMFIAALGNSYAIELVWRSADEASSE
jgi:hypothetical protein